LKMPLIIEWHLLFLNALRSGIIMTLNNKNYGGVQMKKILTSRVLWIVVASIVLLAVIFYPHTKRTKVNGELTGFFVTIEERYILHNKVELTKTTVCVDTVTERVRQTDYKLNGDIKRIFIEFCDGSTSETKYSDNRYIQSIDEVSFSGYTLSSRTRTYNDFGLITYDKQTDEGTVLLYEYEYDTNNKLQNFSYTLSLLNRITYTKQDSYVDGELLSSEINTFENNLLVTEEYQKYDDGVMVLQKVNTYEDDIKIASYTKVKGQTITTISYTFTEDNGSFAAVCDNGVCTVDSYNTDLFEIEYLADEDRFVMNVKEDGTQIPANYSSFIFTSNQNFPNFIESLGEYLADLIS